MSTSAITLLLTITKDGYEGRGKNDLQNSLNYELCMSDTWQNEHILNAFWQWESISKQKSREREREKLKDYINISVNLCCSHEAWSWLTLTNHCTQKSVSALKRRVTVSFKQTLPSFCGCSVCVCLWVRQLQITNDNNCTAAEREERLQDQCYPTITM